MTSSGVLSILASFGGTNGSLPAAALIQGSDGNFYGTTSSGGTSNNGTAFEMTPDGTLTTIVSFTGANGSQPQDALFQASDGKLYGTTEYGGPQNWGTVFRLNINGTTNPPVIVLQPQSQTGTAGTNVTFFVTANGSAPLSYQWSKGGVALVNQTNSALNLVNVQSGDAGVYSVTVSNAVGSVTSSNAVLTIQVVSSSILTTLYNFTGVSDGAHPYAGLVQGTNGSFYGTTEWSDVLFNGNGTVFKMAPNGVLTTLHVFNSGDGANPVAGLFQSSDGNFYGTTLDYGASSFGTAFKMTPNGGLATLISFNGTNGAYPAAGLIQGSDGNFYGTTSQGGTSSNGTAFKMTSDGALVTVVSLDGWNQGGGPEAGLMQGNDGNYYGTTSDGGHNQYGIVFKMTADGALTTLVYFEGTNGLSPRAGLIQATDGNFYGTTAGGGTSESGTVFKMTPTGVLTPLISFNNTNGADPYSGLVQATDGNFYGTTVAGGNTSLNGGYGYGTVFKMTPSGVLTSLISFDGTNGAYPYGGLVQAGDGNLYGTTFSGGISNAGTVFRLSLVETTNPPVITQQPLSQTVAAGTNVTFSVSASGSAPLFYQWSEDGTNLPNQTNATLNLTSVQTGNSGNYAVLVSNAAGSVTSSNATLTVTNNAGGSGLTGDSMTVDYRYPSTNTSSIYSGSTVAYTVGASGTTFTQTNGNVGAELLLNYAITNDTIWISGFQWNNTAVGTTLLFSGNVSFNGEVFTDLSRQLAGVSIDPATTLPNLVASRVNIAGNQLFVDFSGLQYTVGQSLVVLHLEANTNTPPVIVAQPQSQTVVAGTNVTFSVAATGTAPLYYQWLKGGNNLANQTNSTLSLMNVQQSDAAFYSVIVSNATGSTNSYSVLLTVISPPVITTQPVNATVSPNGNATLTVSASGSGLSYQWQLNGVNIAGANGSSLNIPNVSSANVGVYTVVVSNAAGSVTSAPAVISGVAIKMFAGVIVYGALGSNYLIQATGNLASTNWTLLTNIALPSQPYIYIDYTSPTNSQQFYRAVPQ
jgi:uncharacterized repeat protein (TIGR03803 family)